MRNKESYSYSTPAQFVAQFSGALQEYLESAHSVNEKTEFHIVDLAISTSAFSEAFCTIVSHFS